jgi:hypothetical protein
MALLLILNLPYAVFAPAGEAAQRGAIRWSASLPGPLKKVEDKPIPACFIIQANWVYHKIIGVVKSVPLLKTNKKMGKNEVSRHAYC